MTSWFRLTILLLGVLSLLAGVSLWVVTRSWFIAARIRPALEQRLGGNVAIGHAQYQGGGRFILRDLVLRARDHPGPGGEVCRIGRASVIVDADRLLAGEARIEDVEFSEVTVRFSEDIHQAGVFTFMSLAPDWSRDGDRDEPGALPPRLRLDRATVEVGVHDGADYTLRGARVLSGAMTMHPSQEGWYALSLVEVNERGEVLEEGGIRVEGEWNVRSNEHDLRLDGIELDARAFGLCPEVARLWWERMALTGRVHAVEVRWSPPRDFNVELEVKDVGLTLPIETGDLWARFQGGQILPFVSRPRMQVSSGRIQLARDRVSLDNLVGELQGAEAEDSLVGVPYRVDVTISQFPELDWADRQRWTERVLAAAPFEMRFRMDNFRVQREPGGEPPAVELPMAVARVLERFHLSDWTLTTSIAVTRQPPDEDGLGGLLPKEIRTSGQAYINDASGTYSKFRYPLTGVDAHLNFDNESITVHYLTGRGSGDAKVRMRGTIAPPSIHPGVSLRLTATDVPVDEHLRGALKDNEQKIFDAMLHAGSMEALGQADLLVDDEAIEEAVGARRLLASERSRLLELGDGRSDEQQRQLQDVQQAIGRLSDRIEAGPFRLSGTVNLDLQIERPEGRGQRTVTTGTVTIDRVGVLYERFPYPLQILGGQVRWENDRIAAVVDEQGHGLPVVTPVGGKGELTGEILIERVDGRKRARPDVTLRVTDDRVNELIYAAIPPTRSQRDDGRLERAWPGGVLAPAAAWLKELDLDARLDYTAHITSDEDGDLDYRINVDCTDGVADPGPAAAEVLGGGGMVSSDDWRLDDCRAHLTVSRDAIELDRFTGRHRHGRLDATGRVDVRNEPVGLSFAVHLANTELGDYLIDLVPAEGAETAQQLWARYRPEGTFDADLVYRRTAGQAEPVCVDLVPDEVAIRINDEPLTLTRFGGSVRVDRQRVRFEDLELGVATTDRDDGVLTLGGSYGVSTSDDGQALTVTGRWTAGQMQSPLVGEVLRRFGASEQADRLDAMQPRGRFDATFQYQSALANRPKSYEVHVQPQNLAFRLRGTPISIELDQGAATFTPGRIVLEGSAGRHSAGRFELTGEIDTSGPLDARLRLAYEGRLLSGEVAPFLPDAVKDALTAIEFREAAPSTLSNGRLRLVRQPGDAESNQWMVIFDGDLAIRDASFSAGLLFDDVDGQMHIHASHDPHSPPSLNIEAQLEHARALGQELTSAEVAIALDSDGSAVRLQSFRGHAGEGVVTAEASVEIGQELDYAVTARLVDVPLGDFLIAPPDAGDDRAEPSGDGVTGRLFACLDLCGRRAVPASRCGRGTARVLEGDLAEIPLTLQLMQLLQFTLPAGGLEYADAEFFIAGDRVVFERLMFEDAIGDAAALQLTGFGEMDLADYQLNLQFSSRSGVLGLRDLVGGVGDQLATITVTGRLWDPSAQIVPLPPDRSPPPWSISAAPAVIELED